MLLFCTDQIHRYDETTKNHYSNLPIIMPKRYQLLSSKSSDCTDEFSPNNYEECRQAEQELALARARKFVYMLCILLGVSVIFNLLQLSKALGALRNFSEPSFGTGEFATATKIA